MRRSICICEPQVALAGEVSQWKFVYTTATSLPKGARLRFDMQNKGRVIDWERPHTDIKKGSNVIWAYIDPSKPIYAKAVEIGDKPLPQYEFVLPHELKTGQNLYIIVGAPPKTTPSQFSKLGNRAQTTVQRRRQFLLYVDPKASGRYEEPEIFSLDIRGSKLHAIRITTPSTVLRNKRFDIIVRFEDEFGNLTNNAPEGTLIELTHEHLRENLSWKLFVPETGFVTLPNLYFNEEGIYRIQLKNMQNKERFVSAPIKCFAETSYQLLWGLLHGESIRVDSAENIENCLRHFRDEQALSFFSTSCFDSLEETPNEVWKLICQYVAEFNEDDRFSTFLGFQWKGEDNSEGLKQMIYLKDNKPILRQKDIKSNTLKKIYKTLTVKDLLGVPTFSAAKCCPCDFKDWSPEYERVVEIYNAWGSSECNPQEGNTRPIRGNGKKGIGMVQEGLIQEALKNNCRVGFTAGGLDDRGVYAGFYDSQQAQYSPGLTAVMATGHTRESIIEALQNRHCYATTGPRIILGLFLAGSPMGSELDTKTRPGLSVNRHLSGYVAGTAPVKKVELIRNGKTVATFSSKEHSLEFSFDDSDELKKITFNGQNDKPPFLYYYLRVTQEDGHMAWSSPIWLDYHGDLIASASKQKKKTSKKSP